MLYQQIYHALVKSLRFFRRKKNPDNEHENYANFQYKTAKLLFSDSKK